MESVIIFPSCFKSSNESGRYKLNNSSIKASHRLALSKIESKRGSVDNILEG